MVATYSAIPEPVERMVSQIINEVSLGQLDPADLRQELYLLWLEKFGSYSLPADYVFISLKNRAISWLRRESRYMAYWPIEDGLFKEEWTPEREAAFRDRIDHLPRQQAIAASLLSMGWAPNEIQQELKLKRSAYYLLRDRLKVNLAGE